MNRFYTTCLLLFSASCACHAQFVLRGFVRDTTDYMPGVNVAVVANRNIYNTVTDANGAFTLKYPQATAKVEVSFIGYFTQTVTLDTTQETIITLIPYDASVFPDSTTRYAQLRFDLGYYGDASHAPKGILVVIPFQWVAYRKKWIVYTSFKYWEGGGNEGMDASVTKSLYHKKRALPNHLFLSYRSYNYRNEGFRWTQYRTLVSKSLANFALDIGAAYNKIDMGTEAPIDDGWRLSGSIGIAYKHNVIGDAGWGLHTNLNYTTDYAFFEAGAFKQFPVRGRAVTALVKYYQYQKVTGVMFGLTANMLTTNPKQKIYICCYSRPMPNDYVHVLK